MDNQKNIYKKLLPIAILLSLSINCLAMQNFTTKIEVLGKSPKQIYDFMFQLDNEKYKAWHNEHRDFRIIKQTADTLGSVFFFDEKMKKCPEATINNNRNASMETSTGSQ